MICNNPRCKDKSPHDWGDDGCERPGCRCRICGEYFDQPNHVQTQRATLEQEAVWEAQCPKCHQEDWETMHDGFERGDEVAVLRGTAWIPGVYYRPINNFLSIIEMEGQYPHHLISNIFNTTKSGWLKLCERLESQRAAIDDSLKSADDEIKKIEEEEKK